MADQPTKKVGIKARGFASMDPELRRELARKGGRSVPAEKRTFSGNSTLASAMGAKGGKSVSPEKRAFSKNNDLAKSAGRAGGRGGRTHQAG